LFVNFIQQIVGIQFLEIVHSVLKVSIVQNRKLQVCELGKITVKSQGKAIIRTCCDSTCTQAENASRHLWMHKRVHTLFTQGCIVHISNVTSECQTGKLLTVIWVPVAGDPASMLHAMRCTEGTDDIAAVQSSYESSMQCCVIV